MTLPKNSTVLFFSPHPDDESISSAALLHDLVKLGNTVTVYFLANSPKGVVGTQSDKEKIHLRQEEGRAGCHVLGAKAEFLNLDNPLLEESAANVEIIRAIILAKKPSLIITTSIYEAHPTHQKTTRLIEKALEGNAIPLWYGEVWTPVAKPAYMHLFNEDVMEIKLKALSQYKSQIKRTNWLDACKSLNSFRALTAKEVVGNFGSAGTDSAPYAEAFEIKA
jgi:LmbE family N-acetylglucosaminyl deacetylase